MIDPMASTAEARVLLMPRASGWIYKPSWDLTLIIGSAILVPMPFLLAIGAQATGWFSQSQAIDLVNIMVAALIGGPHLFSTVTYTFLDGKFRARHPWYSSLALLLPVVVVLLGVYQYRLLVTLFFTWRGEVQSGFVQGLVRRGSMAAYYSVFAAATGLMVLVTVAVRRLTTLSPDQSYFIVVLSVLLMHYYFDHFLFSQPELLE